MGMPRISHGSIFLTIAHALSRVATLISALYSKVIRVSFLSLRVFLLVDTGLFMKKIYSVEFICLDLFNDKLHNCSISNAFSYL